MSIFSFDVRTLTTALKPPAFPAECTAFCPPRGTLELTGRGLPRKTVAGESAHGFTITCPPALPKLGLLTMERNGPAVPLHGTRVEVLRRELAARGVSPLYILKLEQF